MNHLSEGLRAALTPTMAEELQLFLADMIEVAEKKEHTLKLTLEKLLQDIKELEHSRKKMEEERESERLRMSGAMEAAQRDVQEHHREALNRLKSEAQRKTEECQLETQRRYNLEAELKRVTLRLEQKEEEDYEKMMAKETEKIIAQAKWWDSQTRQREECALSIALSAVVKKQRLMTELKRQAEKWMVAGGSIQEACTTGKVPLVFQTWLMRNEWQKLQDNNVCLNDSHQRFIKQMGIEEVILKNQSLKGNIQSKFEKKMEQHMKAAREKQEKIRAADLKKMLNLEKKTKKKLEKIQKAELKEKQRQEAKEKKEAKRLEKKRAQEERRTRPSIFCFCSSSRN